MKKTYSLYVLAMLGVILALGLVLTGCEMNADDEDEDGGTPQTSTRSPLTFTITVRNDYSWAITKIEFINGPRVGDPILETKAGFNIHTGESGDYTVSGFTQAQKGSDSDTEYRYVGIKVYASNGQTAFTSAYQYLFHDLYSPFSFNTNDFSSDDSGEIPQTTTRDPLVFAIKVTNTSSYTITKIEFINGIQSADPVIETKSGLTINTNESGSYTVWTVPR